MNILYDHQIFQAQKFGGISRYFYELITRVAEMPGVRVSVFQGLHINKYGLDGDGFRRPEIPRTGRIFSAINNVLFRRFAVRSRAEVYHPTYYDDPYPGLRAMRVLTVHDMTHELFPNDFPGDLTAQHKRVAVQKADWIIAVSESTKRDLVRILGTAPEKIKVVHHANSLRSEPSEKLVHRAPYFLFVGSPEIPARPYIVYVGARGGYKNFAGLLRAFATSEFLKTNFSIVCFGGGPFTSTEREQVARSGLRADCVIQMTGGDQVLGSVYRNAAALVYPSLYEGFGLPPLEAMTASCAVVCSKTSSLPEVCGKAAEYFDPYAQESIAASIERVVGSPDRKKELIALGLQQIQKFSWDVCARQTAAVYASII